MIDGRGPPTGSAAEGQSGSIEPRDLTREVLVGYFGEHCECRPLDVERMSHSHDCDDDPCEDVRVALGGRPNGCGARSTTDAIIHEQAARSRICDRVIEKGGDLAQLAALGRKLIDDSARLIAGHLFKGSTMTFRTLFEVMRQFVSDNPDHEALDRQVVVRIGVPSGDDDEDIHVGGLQSASVDAGCTEEFVLVLDADQDPDEDQA